MVIVGGMLRLLLLLGSHHPRGRALLSVLGIALGVALGYGVYLVNLAAAAAELAKGDGLRRGAGNRTVGGGVAGVGARKGGGGRTDIAPAQWRLGRLGQLSRLDVRLKRGADREAVRLRIAALLPPGVHVAPVQALEQASSYPSRAYRVNLDVLAMVALFTGGFLVFSAQALQVARRRGEHALLRVLGLRRRGVLQLVLLEAAALGAIGGLVGLALGYALALAAVRASGADLGAGVFRGLSPKLDFSLVPAFFYLAAGIAVAAAGALLPALDAARQAPAQALKAGDEQRLFARLSSPWPGLAFILAGAALAQLGPVGGLPIYGYAAIGCLLVGSIALMPRPSQAGFDALPLPRSPGLALALAQLRGAPGQAAVSLPAIVASFSLMAAMAIMVASFRQSVDDWLNTVLPAELYFRTSHAGDTGYLEPGFEERVRALPQVARADFLRSGRILLDPSRPPLVLIARDRAEKAFPKVGAQYTRKPEDPPLVWVSEAVGDLFGFSAGQRIELPINAKSVSLIEIGRASCRERV